MNSIKYSLAAMIVNMSFAIKYGELDGEGHPNVGLMVALDKKNNPLWRCTGSLISDGLFLTAGHCVEQPATSATIWFDTNVESWLSFEWVPIRRRRDLKGHTYPP